MGKRGLFAFCLALLANFAMAATITVTEPVSGAFLGKTNTLRFNITGSNSQVEVTVTTVNVANPSINFTTRQQFTPDVEGRIQGTIALNFSDATPGGAYQITVTAVEPGNFYNSPPVIPVTIDVENPKFNNFNPVSGNFVKGIVPIIVELLEPNIDEWRVQVGGSDIPNNTGTDANFTVNWDTSLISADGPQDVNITVKDKAKNSDSKTISLTIDRIVPSSEILSPRAGDPIRPNSNITVVVNVQDQFQNSVNETGVQVTAEHLDGTFIGRVARRSVQANGTALTWTGRIRAERNFPATFKLVVRATDRAGNEAVIQEVVLSSDRGRAPQTYQSIQTASPVGSGTATISTGKTRANAGNISVGGNTGWHVLPGTNPTTTPVVGTYPLYPGFTPGKGKSNLKKLGGGK